MCGIAYTKFDVGNANQFIKKLYYNQKLRGQEGYGFVSLDGKIEYHRSRHEQEIFAKMKKCGSKEILFHHRKPTSTENTELGAQPICTTDKYYDSIYFLAHNGSIQNHAELYNKHKELGIKYSTLGSHNGVIGYNDSESLLHELALYIEKKQKLEDFDARGPMAFILVQMDRDGTNKQVFFGHNVNSPLKFYQRENTTIISSAGPGADVELNKLYSFGEDNILFVRDLHMHNWVSIKMNWKTLTELKSELAQAQAEKDIGEGLLKQEKDPDEKFRLQEELADVNNKIKDIEKEIKEKKDYRLPTGPMRNTTPVTFNKPASTDMDEEDMKQFMGH